MKRRNRNHIIEPVMEHYIHGQPTTFDICDGVIYDTVTIRHNFTTAIAFFQDGHGKHIPADTNMYMPGMLPQPQALLIRSIRLTGITSAIHHAGVRLQIGNRIYLTATALSFARKGKGYKLGIPLFIPSMMVFNLEVYWGFPVFLGQDFMGNQLYKQKLRAELIGEIARPMQ